MSRSKNKKDSALPKVLLLILMISLSLLGIAFVSYGMYSQYTAGTGDDSEYEEPEDEENRSPGNGGELLDGDDELRIREDEAVIYIGDSRFVGMNDACRISDEPGRFVVAEVGQGYNWLERTALAQAQDIESMHPEYTKFYYVICLGINDLVNIDQYMEMYRQLSTSKNLILVSVGPVGERSVITNDRVAEFNSRLMSLGYPYVDYNSILMSEGFSTPDGLHYTDESYERIYEIIKEGIGDKE